MDLEFKRKYSDVRRGQEGAEGSELLPTLILFQYRLLNAFHLERVRNDSF